MFVGNTAIIEDAVSDVEATLGNAPAVAAALAASVAPVFVDQELHFDLTVPRLDRAVRAKARITGAAGAPLVAVLGGISATRHVVDGANVIGELTGWWRDFSGPGKAIDTDACRVLGFDFPAINADNDDEVLTTADQADLLVAVLDALGEDSFAAVIGSSYGAMVGLALAANHPERTGRVVAISGGHASHPLAQAWRSTQRKIVKMGLAAGEGREALALARGLAMTTYRSVEEFGERFAGAPKITEGELRLPVDSYLEARGADFAARVSPEHFLELSVSLDSHRVAPEDIAIPVTIVAIRQDLLVPVSQMRELRDRLGGPVDYIEIDSNYGHDAFLKEVDALAPVLRSAITNTAITNTSSERG